MTATRKDSEASTLGNVSTMIPVEYNSNNSGGSWWLTAKDWAKLKKAGWKVFSYGDFAYKDGVHIPDKDGLPSYMSEVEDRDEPKFNFDSPVPKEAYKLFNTIGEALAEFEKLTGQDVTAEGCGCCGPPHSFTWGKDIIVRLPKERLSEQDYHYASGEGLLGYMYPGENVELSKRELIELQRHDRTQGGSDE